MFDKIIGKKEHSVKNNKLIDTSALKIISRMMDEEQFWNIVQKSLKETKNQNDQEAWLINELQKSSLEEIIGFRLRTDKLLYDSFTAEILCVTSIMNGSCTDDDFEYFRLWLISRGKDVYQKAQINPDSLINEVVDGREIYSFESFWYVALEAFKRNTGKYLYDYVDYDNFKTHEGKYPGIEIKWDEDRPETRKRICPKLCEKFCSQNKLNS